MSITILSPYRLFFIDESDFLFVLMKDGRLSKIKKVNSFSALSADFKHLGGVSFDEKNTHITQSSLNFDNQPPTEITSLFGYFYYPVFNSTSKKLAVIEADLLSPLSSGRLCLFQKKIKNWKKITETPAQLKPPFWSRLTDSLFFFNTHNELICLSHEEKALIAKNAYLAALSPLQSEIVFFDGSHIRLYSLIQKNEEIIFPAPYTTAVCFDEKAQNIFYATSFEGKHAIYSFNRMTQKTYLLCETITPIHFLCP